ncbi:MAG: HEPN domain-containing protein [Planctomycetota bacterium]
MAVTVSEAEKPLVYIARLSNAEKNALYEHGDAFPELEVRKQFHQAIAVVLHDRLKMATENFVLADDLFFNATPTNAHYRAVVNRAYYAIHHSIRVMVLSQNHCEADGHEEAIQELKKLLKDEQFRKKCGLNENTITEISRARDNRSVADYSPYDFSRRDGTTVWVAISGNTWKSTAEFNLNLAERLLDAAKRFIGLV